MERAVDADATTDEAVRRVEEYLAALELPDADPGLEELRGEWVELTDGDAGGAVDAGAIVSFVAGLTSTHKEDVLNSTLLAQLAANKLCDREEQTKEWYAKYHEVLENIGWVVSSFDFSKYTATSSQFEVEKVVLEILGAIATGPEIAVAIAILNALKSVSGESKAFKLWDEQTNNGSKGNFQIGTCIESDGNVAMSLGAFYFKATQVDFQFLWFKYASDKTEIYKAGQQVVLNEQVYAKVRQQIKDKLGDKAVDYVANLDI